MRADPTESPYSRVTDVTTRPTLLTEAEADGIARKELCDRYAPVVFTAYLGFTRGRPNARDDARDMTHGFLAQFFLDRNEDGVFRFAKYLAKPAAERGRFLAYTLAAAKKFRIDEHRGGTTVANGRGWRRVEIDADPARFADCLESLALGPAEQVEAAYTASVLWQAAVRVRDRLVARPADPLGQAFHDALAAGTVPRLASLATVRGVSEKHVRKNWEAFRADRALAEYLLDAPPPYAALAASLKVTPEALETRFSKLRGTVRVELERILADESDADDARESAAEVVRLLGVLKGMVKMWESE